MKAGDLILELMKLPEDCEVLVKVIGAKQPRGGAVLHAAASVCRKKSGNGGPDYVELKAI